MRMQKKNSPRKFAVFILSNGRADSVITYETLKRSGYTGPVFIVCDDEDKQLKEYIAKYGKETVIIFNKQKAIDLTDSGDNLKKRNSVVYARNYNFVIAKEMGLTHFIQLDDDYVNFRYVVNNKGQFLTNSYGIYTLDRIIEALFNFLDASKATAIAIAQSGDFIGGGQGTFVKKISAGSFSRKLMNFFVFKTDQPIKFKGRINEDVNVYVADGRKGSLFITISFLGLKQIDTQQNSGGLTDIYLDLGTYTKSFYSVLYAPSCVRVAMMGAKDKRLHHEVNWRHTTPLIIDQDHKHANAKKAG